MSVPKIVCDWCKRPTPLDRILRRFQWMAPTLFICDDCEEDEQDG